nr:hypothetical protein [uncultured Sphingomonas sp.]
MKTLLSITAALAVMASVPATAQERGPGHWEWQTRHVPGPNKSNRSPLVRVWVKDAPAVASCDCAMMRDAATAAECMAMPRKGSGPSQG